MLASTGTTLDPVVSMAARFSPPIRGSDALALVPQRGRPQETFANPVYLPRARTRDRHLLVSDRHSRAVAGSRQAAGKALGGVECGIPLILLPCCNHSSQPV